MHHPQQSEIRTTSKLPSLAYVSLWNTNEVNHWSGLGYFIARALESQFGELDVIDQLPRKYWALQRARQLLHRITSGKRFDPYLTSSVLEHFASYLEPRLSASEADIVFSPSSIPVAALNTDKPIVFWTDATFGGMLNYYPSYANLSKATIRNGHAMEQAALDNCSLAIYSSDWAAQTAIENYKADPAKIKVVPFGLNLVEDRGQQAVESMIRQRTTDRCELLWVGVEWYRKNGDLAIEICKSLNEMGLPARLTMVGAQPPKGTKIPDNIDIAGFISKQSTEGSKRIQALYAKAHFLILPTRADCTPMVFAEANSFGLPVFTTHTGGIPTLIREGQNGWTFPVETEAEAYAHKIVALMQSPETYREAARKAYAQYRDRLNWNVAATSVKNLLVNLVKT
jgi:glycosyltransferase involved in cell wall biosynthesis